VGNVDEIDYRQLCATLILQDVYYKSDVELFGMGLLAFTNFFYLMKPSNKQIISFNFKNQKGALLPLLLSAQAFWSTGTNFE